MSISKQIFALFVIQQLNDVRYCYDEQVYSCISEVRASHRCNASDREIFDIVKASYDRLVNK